MSDAGADAPAPIDYASDGAGDIFGASRSAANVGGADRGNGVVYTLEEDAKGGEENHQLGVAKRLVDERKAVENAARGQDREHGGGRPFSPG